MMFMLNDIMERNANSYDAGADYHLSQDLAWVLTEYQLEISKLPKAQEKIIVGTIPYSFKRMFGYRKYQMRSQSGEVYLKGKGKFALINIKTKQFVRPEQSLLERFKDAKKTPESLPFDAWEIDEKTFIHKIERFVSADYMDVNGHLNNAFFPTFSYQVLPTEEIEQQNITAIFVKYKKEAFTHDVISLYLYRLSSGYLIDIKREDEVLGNVLFKTKTL